MPKFECKANYFMRFPYSTSSFKSWPAIVFFLLISFTWNAAAQNIKLIYVKGDKVTSENGVRLTPNQVKDVLKVNPAALELYETGRNKSGFGGFFLGFGLGLGIGDLAAAMYGGKEYPSGLTYAAAGSILVSIPILIGHSKKIRQAVELYNNGTTGYQPPRLNFITDRNGAGVRLSF